MAKFIVQEKKGTLPKAKSTLRISNPVMSVKVACEASNDILVPVPDRREFTLRVTNLPTTENEEEDSKYSNPPDGFCALYNGKICKGHRIGLFWFNATEGNAGGLINEQITIGLWDELIVGLAEPCRSAAEVIFLEIFLKALYT